ncbi:hypothetical protein ACA910_021121 [Epithemia clementina (nom. ined.)]
MESENAETDHAAASSVYRDGLARFASQLKLEQDETRRTAILEQAEKYMSQAEDLIKDLRSQWENHVRKSKGTTSHFGNGEGSLQEAPNVLHLKDIASIVKSNQFRQALIQAISDGFVAFEKGDFFSAPIQTLGAPPMAPFVKDVPDYAGQTCIKSGYFRNNPYYVIKVASGGNPLPNSGLMQVFSQKTGRLAALLLDEGILTELRTAAVGALSVQLFGPKNYGKIQSIGILGTGIQARYQLRMLQSVTQCRNVLVWGRTLAKAQSLQAEMSREGWTVSIANEADELLTMCDVIVTTTCAREPVLGNSIRQDEQENGSIRSKLITCIGADAPGKRELSSGLVAKADLKVADSLEQTVVRGEFQYSYFSSSSPQATDDIVSLGMTIRDPNLQRRSDADDDRLIIFDSSGVSLQDCVIAQMVMEHQKT